MVFQTMKPIYLHIRACTRGSDMSGGIHTVQAESTESFVESIDGINTTDSHTLVFISRYPASRLLDLLDISEIQCYWLSNSDSTGAIEPSLEKINHFSESLIASGKGILYIEGLEWLVSLHGFEAVHSMLRSLAETVAMSEWTIYLALYNSSFTSQELSRILREAPLFTVEKEDELVYEQIDDSTSTQDVSIQTNVEMDLNEDGTTKLVLLTKLPRSGFTKQILQRRILQWRRMGLDTSEIESSLYSNDVDSMYAEYITVEEKIRRATELERYVVANITDTQERAIALFRIRQLTGLDHLEREYFSD